jgi:mannose-6-phosphate isomerase-like protein (cupin superfamily)
MNPLNPLLPFGPAAERPYGSIRLFDEKAAEAYSLPFKYSRFIVQPGLTSTLDQHKVVETWVIISGTGRLLVDDVEYAVTRGDVVHLASMLRHQVTNTGTEDLEIFSFWWSDAKTAV